MYRQFFPTVSGLAIFKGNERMGIMANKVFGTLETRAEARRIHVELGYAVRTDAARPRHWPAGRRARPGPLIVCSMDVNQRWVADMGLPGPDAGNGGKHLLLPPDYTGDVPSSGYYVHRASSNRQIIGARSLPVNGDVQAAKERLKTIKVYPLSEDARLAGAAVARHHRQDRRTPRRWRGRTTSSSGRCCAETVDDRTALRGLPRLLRRAGRAGHREGQTVRARRTHEAASSRRPRGSGNAQMRVAVVRRSPSRPHRLAGSAAGNGPRLRFEDGDFNTRVRLDTRSAREVVLSGDRRVARRCSARTRRPARCIGSALRDRDGALPRRRAALPAPVPLPVPGKLFWSVTVYDADTRSQIQTDAGQGGAALAVRAEGRRRGQPSSCTSDRRALDGREADGSRPLPGKGWFVYFRIYGPEEPAFDGNWKPGDFEAV